MSFEGAIRLLNRLKQRKVIRDYALIGAVAAAYYMEPLSTEDLDVIVLVDSDEEYIQAFSRLLKNSWLRIRGPKRPARSATTRRNQRGLEMLLLIRCTYFVGAEHLLDLPLIGRPFYPQPVRRIGESAERMEGMHYVLDDVPVQIFPSTTKPLYRDVIAHAHEARSGPLRVKVATPEHLVVMLLEAYRPKDKARLPSLLEAADNAKLRGILSRFDDEQHTLIKRFETLRGEGV